MKKYIQRLLIRMITYLNEEPSPCPACNEYCHGTCEEGTTPK